MGGKGEIIQIHIGQAGVQIANACWELYCHEHGIMYNGRLMKPCDDSFLTFFEISGMQPTVQPRLVMIDTEPTVIDEIRTGAYRNLFHPDTLITGKDDSGSNFARGYNLMASELLNRAMNAIRRVADHCHNLRGFLIFRSIGGGTGSGLGTRIMEKLVEDFGKKMTVVEFLVYPSPSISPVIVEPYNALLSTHFSMDYADVSFIVDNEALYDICAQTLNVPAPTYTNLNRIIGQVVAAFTATQRFSGQSVSFQELQTNLVPYPRIHYPLLNYAPLVPVSHSEFVDLSTAQLTSQCFSMSNQMVRCNPEHGKYMACVLFYRGEVAPNEINLALENIKRSKSFRFVDWSPTGFKIGVSPVPPVFVPHGDLAPTKSACVAISNNTNIRMAWCRLVNKFDKLYQRRAFVYHYVGEGLEEGNFNEASENICQLVHDYIEVDASAPTSRRESNDGE
ncbi:tubulin alpha chain [Drosophila grimshawi]|uniref:Tubulin alpha chain n=1 Tax=Drosophila grimshawi TaxID=7222 RepID=B4JUT7_DROGR|nr:tubulin alpha chain [Drosophila grimshawi]EDV91257.1 GH15056 [Drosophila grimshawi]